MHVTAEQKKLLFGVGSCSTNIQDQVFSCGGAAGPPRFPPPATQNHGFAMQGRAGLPRRADDATFHYGTHKLCIMQNRGFVSQGLPLPSLDGWGARKLDLTIRCRHQWHAISSRLGGSGSFDEIKRLSRVWTQK